MFWAEGQHQYYLWACSSPGDSHVHLNLRSTRLPTGQGHLVMSAFGSNKKLIKSKLKLQDIYLVNKSNRKMDESQQSHP